MRAHSIFAAMLLGALAAPALAADTLPEGAGTTGPRLGRNADRWEVRLGGGVYDAGPFTPDSFTGGVVNGEILSPSWDILAPLGSPRPYVGAELAVSDDPIHAFYAGLNWELSLTQRFYVGFSLGGALVSDERVESDEGKVRDLGSPVLFHLQASAGFDLTPNLGAQVYLNHYSNATLAEPNNGLEASGARLVWRF